MKKLVEYLVESIIGKDFAVEETQEEDQIILTIKAPKKLLGQIIGKDGHTIKAIQDIVRIKATLEKQYVYVKVEEKN